MNFIIDRSITGGREVVINRMIHLSNMYFNFNLEPIFM